MNEDAPHFRLIDRIAFPSDFSEDRNGAFAHALRIAQGSDAELLVLHVDPRHPDHDWNDYPAVQGMLDRWGTESDRLTMACLNDRNATHGVLHFLDDHEVDLVVLSLHQDHGPEHWLHQALADQVARKSHEPALFVPVAHPGFVQREDGAAALRRILIPIDYDPNPQPASNLACHLAEALGCADAELTFLHVGYDSLPAFKLPDAEAWKYETRMEQGKPVEVILEVAQELDADLITMATADHHGLFGALRGTTAERVVRNAPCPVLAVPSAI